MLLDPTKFCAMLIIAQFNEIVGHTRNSIDHNFFRTENSAYINENEHENPATEKMEAHHAGEAMGYIIELENGFKIWDMGDTGLFGDMKFIGEYYKPDLVMIPIGGNFTMGPEDAAYALRTWVKPKMVIPMHYNSNPLAKGTLAEFQAAMKGSNIKIIPMTEGETIQF
jgi:L-ascorbate metabolism protein UlaG (beta-lactamase superfamily)